MGAIAFGKRLFGKVDRVRGRYHVATLCWHFCYLPLLPLGTFLVLQEEMRGMTTHFRGVRIPFSWKSLLVAWSRSLLAFPFFISLVAIVIVVSGQSGHPNDTWLQRYGVVLVAAVISGMLWLPYLLPGIGRATARRADELARVAGTSQERTVGGVQLHN
jgi:hypothetical protein